MIQDFQHLNHLDDIVTQIDPTDLKFLTGTRQTGKQLWKGSVSNARRLALLRRRITEVYN